MPPKRRAQSPVPSSPSEPPSPPTPPPTPRPPPPPRVRAAPRNRPRRLAREGPRLNHLEPLLGPHRGVHVNLSRVIRANNAGRIPTDRDLLGASYAAQNVLLRIPQNTQHAIPAFRSIYQHLHAHVDRMLASPLFQLPNNAQTLQRIVARDLGHSSPPLRHG